MDPETVYLHANIMFDENNEFLLNGRHVLLFLEDLERKDPIISFPVQFIAIGLTSVLLRGLAHAFVVPQKYGMNLQYEWCEYSYSCVYM